MTTFDNMYLYVKPGCPFCKKVDRFLDNAGIEMEHRSVAEGTNADDLIAIGGKLQSPCLIVDGKAMYESGDIINYLYDLTQGKIAVQEAGRADQAKGILPSA